MSPPSHNTWSWTRRLLRTNLRAHPESRTLRLHDFVDSLTWKSCKLGARKIFSRILWPLFGVVHESLRPRLSLQNFKLKSIDENLESEIFSSKRFHSADYFVITHFWLSKTSLNLNRSRGEAVYWFQSLASKSFFFHMLIGDRILIASATVAKIN